MALISNELAQEIADTTSRILGHNVIITDCDGIVIGAHDRSRLGTCHEASVEVVRAGCRLDYDQQQAGRLKGTKPGVASPVIFNKKVVGVLAITGDPDAVGMYAELVRSQVEMMIQQAFLLEVSLLRSKAVETLILEILAAEGTSQSDATLLTRSEVLGYDLKLPRAALVVEVKDFAALTLDALRQGRGAPGEIRLQELKNNVLKSLERAAAAGPQDILSFLAQDKFVLLKTVSAAQPERAVRLQLKSLGSSIFQGLSETLKLQAAVGIGSYYPGLAGLAQSYREALRALAIGGEGGEPVYHIQELGAGHILSALRETAAAAYFRSTLAELRRSHQYPALRQTLLALWENNLNLTRTARRLYVHRNTLNYRIAKIKEATGLDARQSGEAMQLYLAVKLEELAGDGRQ